MNPTVFWLILGVILIIAEILTPSFFLMWFGIGALVSAFFAWIWVDAIWLQMVIFIFVSLLLVLSTRRLANKISGNSPRKIMQDDLVGQEGVVISKITADGTKGLVRVQGVEWRAVPLEEKEIDAGMRVTVVSLNGVKLKVVPRQNDSQDT
ncbi:MAG TPA: NfeD family protein [Thermotogota bacterium]|nr:NfeD family protein [Thermotogota bacterium]HRW92282.1 NfeD family protein [Thermotogota bacterium]